MLKNRVDSLLFPMLAQNVDLVLAYTGYVNRNPKQKNQYEHREVFESFCNFS